MKRETVSSRFMKLLKKEEEKKGRDGGAYSLYHLGRIELLKELLSWINVPEPEPKYQLSTLPSQVIGRWIHKKTGNRYVVKDVVKNCTNENDGQEMIFYVDMEGRRFVRESGEFFLKFRREQ